jgi:hypothetical protein
VSLAGQNRAHAGDVSDDPGVGQDIFIKFRVSQVERDALVTAAKKSGLTLSEYCRLRLLTITVEAPVIKLPSHAAKKPKGRR